MSVSTSLKKNGPKIVVKEVFFKNISTPSLTLEKWNFFGCAYLKHKWATCPITEECPVPKKTLKLISTLVIFDHLNQKSANMAI